MLWDIIWRKKTTFSLGFCLSFSILCLFWQGNIFSRGVGFVGSLSDRISHALNSGLRFTGTLWVALDDYRELKKRNEAMQKTLETHRLERDKFDQLKGENERLRKLMGFSPVSEHPELRAEVLGVQLNSISPRIIIGKGKRDGVGVYMPVIARSYDASKNLIRAVVGIVIAVDANTAVVQPMNHPGFRLGVRMPDTGQWAIMTGNSGNLSEALLTYIAQDASPNKATISTIDLKLKLKQSVHTSGMGGIFPRGIPVGVLTRNGPRKGEFKTAFVRPFAPIGNLDYVTIIIKKPEAWRNGSGKLTKWDEHLTTPFGKLEFPENLRRKKRRAPKKAAARTRRKTEPTRTVTKKKETTGGTGSTTGPRVIRNVPGGPR